MLALQIEFLTGRYVATAHHDRTEPEWPPHPARLFSTLVDTWATTGPEDEPDEDERAVLEWLESLPPPEIAASQAAPRPAVTHYVPVNDIDLVSRSMYVRRYAQLADKLATLDEAIEQADGDLTASPVQHAVTAVERLQDVTDKVVEPGPTPVKTGVALLPENRPRQARRFPSVTPESPIVTLAWPEARPTADQRKVLDGLLSRVVRLGHSSSLVACTLVEEPPIPTWTVDADGDDVLRGTGPGQLRALERAFERHRGQGPRSLPHRAVRYRSPRQPEPVRTDDRPRSNLAGEWFVFEHVSRRGRSKASSSGVSLPSPRTVDVTRALRKAVISYADDPLPELLCGHRPDGSPTEHPHAAFLALPFVGHEHATGNLLGCAVVLPVIRPDEADDLDEARRALMQAIGRWEQERAGKPLEVQMGSAGVMCLRRVPGRSDRATTRPDIWTRSSTKWVSATPVALHRHPGDLSRGGSKTQQRSYDKACAAIAEACTHLGLDTPEDVEISRTPLLTGTAPARRFPAFVQGKDRIQRLLVHARVRFAEPVEGPVILGAGRYLGLGLMRPLDM